MKDLMDILATGFLFLTIGGALYALAMLIFNGFLSALKFRIKLPVQKRFVGKMTPIYRLTNWDDYEKKQIYFIQKWVLEYTDIEMGSWQTIWIPFSSLFQRLQYVEQRQFSLGELSDDVVATLNLEENWNYEFEKWNAKNKKEEDKVDKFKKMMGDLNKDFNENYTE
jgi:hypothetical protein